jgi:putative transposase
MFPNTFYHGGQALNHCITLSDQERNTLQDWYRHHCVPAIRLRCHIILLLEKGYTWALICQVLFCSSRTIDRWKRQFQQGRVDALLGNKRGPKSRLSEHWMAILYRWVTTTTPRAFGFFRSRWCCALLALLLWREHRLRVSKETVRRWLHQQNLVFRRPRPTLKRQDPKKQAILDGLRQLLRDLPEDETVVFQDEGDVNLNPDIGFAWMPQGQQAEVETPGDNEKRYLAGSLNWRTGTMITTLGEKRDSKLFLEHIDDLRRKLRCYKKIHIILDNAGFHTSQAVAEYYYRWYGRIEFHFLPKYAPDLNPIERVWWHLREEITRNHTCKSIEELIDLVFGWLENRNPFEIEGSVYANLHENYYLGNKHSQSVGQQIGKS